jgi:hypothetical protein
VRDAVAFETRGLPAVVVTLDVLSDIAHATAASSGANDLVIVLLNAVLFGLTRDEVATAAARTAHDAVRALTELRPTAS